jgi:hypothetical protein
MFFQLDAASESRVLTPAAQILQTAIGDLDLLEMLQVRVWVDLGILNLLLEFESMLDLVEGSSGRG